ncbi:hypothetical protein NOV72_02627 [Caballeronia novacaledonica]|uniref:Uncharacterized protein n=1 Tax=Caballeronia novacaledonica TaxID=1544861 RepID=A0A2U3I5M1_9BURK|nr:hypothetical protein [Caballeronia novacaledonica]SPB15401.1 hypothetical protein NOV72_02627 [Caballeronia novacaledonica]
MSYGFDLSDCRFITTNRGIHTLQERTREKLAGVLGCLPLNCCALMLCGQRAAASKWKCKSRSYRTMKKDKCFFDSFVAEIRKLKGEGK